MISGMVVGVSVPLHLLNCWPHERTTTRNKEWLFVATSCNTNTHHGNTTSPSHSTSKHPHTHTLWSLKCIYSAVYPTLQTILHREHKQLLTSGPISSTSQHCTPPDKTLDSEGSIWYLIRGVGSLG